MATYNDKPELLKKAINSIIDQTEKNWEFLIIDDSTNISTINVLNEYINKDNRIRIIRSKLKNGFVKSLNIGLKQASGKYIARMDGDDISMPTRLEKEYFFLEKNPQYHIVGSKVNIINENDDITSQIQFPQNNFKLLLFSMFRCPLQHGDVMMRRTLIDKGFIYDENFEKAEDLELWLRMMKNNYKLYNLTERLYSFRIEKDYAKKRNKAHFTYNLKARGKNFSWKHPISCLIGIIFSYCYMYVPFNVKKVIYDKMNKHKTMEN